MSKWRKPTNPVDRALADLNQQIQSVERQLRRMGDASGNRSVAQPAVPSPVASMRSYVKEMLTPPARRPAAPTAPKRQDLFDVDVNPMSNLEAEPIGFSPPREPDLFAGAAAAAPTGRATGVTATADAKLGRYLAAGSVKIPKPTLKRVRRETRNRFFMWLGLSFVALWLIYAVVR